jgi:hypothetical protein
MTLSISILRCYARYHYAACGVSHFLIVMLNVVMKCFLVLNVILKSVLPPCGQRYSIFSE